MVTLEVDGVPVPADAMHLYAIRFVQVPGAGPDLALYRNGLRVAKGWLMKADVTVSPTSCTAPG
jgi:hypothetical protein